MKKILYRTAFILIISVVMLFCSMVAFADSDYIEPMVSAGGNHSLYLASDGKVYAWGYNEFGQLGDGTITSRDTPLCISDIASSPLYGEKIISISAGVQHSLALTSDGKVYAWGNNYHGQLGNGNNIDSKVPICISDLTDTPLYGNIITSISAGAAYSSVITSDGRAYLWGNNDCGQLGIGDLDIGTISGSTFPMCINSNPPSLLYGKKIKYISTGLNYAFAITTEDKLYAWGYNGSGRLGDGTNNDSTVPICISDINTSILYGKTITTVSAYDGHSLALTTEGKVYAWGDDRSGQLGNGTAYSEYELVCISDIENSPLYGKTIASIATGYSCSFAVASDGKVYTWGANWNRRLGDGKDANRDIPVCISELTNSPLYGETVKNISSYGSHVLTITTDGTIYAWGANFAGQLGNGTTTFNTLPICVSELQSSVLYGKIVKEIATGSNYSLVLTSEGKLYTSGENGNGQLGDGTTDSKFTSVCISDIDTSSLYGKTIKAISAGSGHSLAITEDGKLYGWGANNVGQLGFDSPYYCYLPICISDIETSPLYGKRIKSISAGGDHSLAIT